MGKKRKLCEISSDEVSTPTLHPIAKKQKVSNDATVITNEESSDSDDVDNIKNKRKKRKIKGLSKASSLLNDKSMTSHSVEFLRSSSKEAAIDKMQCGIMDKHNSKQIEKRMKEKEMKESAKQQSIAINEQEMKIREDIGKLAADNERMNMTANRKTMKEKEKLRRMKGQSSQHTWKS